MYRLEGAMTVEDAFKNVEGAVEEDPEEFQDPPQIFISYQSDLDDKVKLLKRHLEMAGYKSWMDIGQMAGGDKLFAKIDEGIRAAKLVICCVSEKYAQSPNCNREVNLSVTLGKPVIPLLMEKMSWPPPGSMGPIFSEYLFVRFFQRAAEVTNDSRYWPADKFQELLMQLRYTMLPDEDLIDTAVSVIPQDEEELVDPPPIFISYQWAHQGEVKLLKRHLEMAGYKSWMDIGQMGGGDKLFAKIDEGIRAAKLVICCVSEKYTKSPHCNREVNLSVTLGKPVIPLLMEKMGWPPPGSMGPIFSEYLFVRFFQRTAEATNDSRYWPVHKFQELLMQLRPSIIPDDGLTVSDITVEANPEEVEDHPPIFISYQWAHQDEVKLLKRHLEMAGYKSWMDIGQMGGGDKLFAKIDEGIRAAKLVICCVSEKYAQSPHCNREVNLSVTLGKPVIPLLMEKMSWPPPGSMGPIFSEYLFVRFFQRAAEATNDSRYWPADKFQELLVKLKYILMSDVGRVDNNFVAERAEENIEHLPIFISYQWAHQDEVKLLKRHLEKAGYKSWMDIGQMGGGDKLFAKIDEGIRAAKLVICCVSEKYAQSPHCNREVNLSVTLGKPVIPLLMEKMSWPPPGSMGPIFSEYLFVRFFQRAAEVTNDSRYWPVHKFQELLMQLRYRVVPDESLIDDEYKDWMNPPEELIEIQSNRDRKSLTKSTEKTNADIINEVAPSPDVFISYQWGKQPQIKVLYRRLVALGLTCWLDIMQMGGGDSLYDKIDKGIRGSKVVLSCVTTRYVQSANCRREVSLADALKKPIVPLLLERTSWPPEGPMGMVFTQLLYINFTKPDDSVQNHWKCDEFSELLIKIGNSVPSFDTHHAIGCPKDPKDSEAGSVKQPEAPTVSQESPKQTNYAGSDDKLGSPKDAQHCKADTMNRPVASWTPTTPNKIVHRDQDRVTAGNVPALKNAWLSDEEQLQVDNSIGEFHKRSDNVRNCGEFVEEKFRPMEGSINDFRSEFVTVNDSHIGDTTTDFRSQDTQESPCEGNKEHNGCDSGNTLARQLEAAHSVTNDLAETRNNVPHCSCAMMIGDVLAALQTISKRLDDMDRRESRLVKLLEDKTQECNQLFIKYSTLQENVQNLTLKVEDGTCTSLRGDTSSRYLNKESSTSDVNKDLLVNTEIINKSDSSIRNSCEGINVVQAEELQDHMTHVQGESVCDNLSPKHQKIN